MRRMKVRRDTFHGTDADANDAHQIVLEFHFVVQGIGNDGIGNAVFAGIAGRKEDCSFGSTSMYS